MSKSKVGEKWDDGITVLNAGMLGGPLTVTVGDTLERPTDCGIDPNFSLMERMADYAPEVKDRPVESLLRKDQERLNLKPLARKKVEVPVEVSYDGLEEVRSNSSLLQRVGVTLDGDGYSFLKKVFSLMEMYGKDIDVKLNVLHALLEENKPFRRAVKRRLEVLEEEMSSDAIEKKSVQNVLKELD